MSQHPMNRRIAAFRMQSGSTPGSGYSATPSPSYSDISLPSHGGPRTPPNPHYTVPALPPTPLLRTSQLPNGEKHLPRLAPSSTSSFDAASPATPLFPPIHPHLSPGSSIPWDVRSAPRHMSREPATQSRLPHIVISASFLPGLPPIVVDASDQVGVTVHDLCDAIYTVLAQPFDFAIMAQTAQFMHVEPGQLANMSTAAYLARCGPSRSKQLEGRKTVDLLTKGFRWAGLVQYGPAHFRMKTPTM